MFLLWYNILYASVAELADALDLGSSAFRRAGSIPVTRTNLINQAHVEFAAWAFLYTEICNSVYTIKLQSKNNSQILHFLLTKKLLAEIIKKHWLDDAGKPDRFVRASEL